MLNVTFLDGNTTSAGTRGCAEGFNASLCWQRANIDRAKMPWGKPAARVGGCMSPAPLALTKRFVSSRVGKTPHPPASGRGCSRHGLWLLIWAGLRR